MTDKPNPYEGLRGRALAVMPEQIGLKLPSTPTTVYGVVVDHGRAGAVVTVTAFATGDASIYVSSGGGFLGGIGRPWINAAAKRCVAVAQETLAAAAETGEETLPGADVISFHLLTTQGRRYGRQTLAQISQPACPWQPLFRAINEVISGYRQLQTQAKMEH